ncbi:MAG: trypsin-like peptidase domain-containing protein [Slackia sp.]|nr:trypsin-like peptidase domain-containing protein [Slackia sp.]
MTEENKNAFENGSVQPQANAASPSQTYPQHAAQPDSYAQQQAAYQQQVYQAYATQGAARHVKPAKDPSAKKSLAKTFGVSFAGAALAVALGLGGFVGFNAMNGGGVVDLGSSSSTNVSASDTEATLAEAVAAKALPSIVSIDVYQHAASSSQSMFGFEVPGAGSDDALQQASLGSGVVISQDGYIITNNHVVEGATALKATVNGQEYDAQLVGSDASSDIAVIKVDATDLAPIEIGSSSDLQVGEWVMSLGSPFGLENSVSEGIVSALQRSTTMQDETTGETVIYPNMIQTDATINPGNSGGALVDADGKLIGINSMIQSASGSSSGVGFAIPVDYAMNLAQQIIDGKAPTHAQLGVSMAQIDEQMARYYGLPTAEGVYVANVYEGTGAAEGGLQRGDIITGFDGKPIASPSDLQLMVREKNPGDVVEVTVNRDGSEQTLSVTLGSDENALPSGEQTRPYGNGGFGHGSGDGYGLRGFGY